MPKIKTLSSLIALSAVGVTLAFAADDAATIQKKLTAEFSTTKTTADLTDIVTAGSILVLRQQCCDRRRNERLCSVPDHKHLRDWNEHS